MKIQKVEEDFCPKCGSDRISNTEKARTNIFDDAELSRGTECRSCGFVFFREYTIEFRNIRYFDKDKDLFVTVQKVRT